MQEVYITHATRTAIGKFKGSLSGISASDLGASVIKSILEKSKIDSHAVDEVILGQVITGGCGQNPARQSVIKAGMPVEIPAMTINKVCGSGLKSVIIAANAIRAGDADLIIAGGQENMSLGMHGLYSRLGASIADSDLIDFMIYDGLTDAFSLELMGVTAENVAKKFGINRHTQDRLALESHLKADRASKSGKFKDEITPIQVSRKNVDFSFDFDESIRGNSSMDALKMLKPVFLKGGVVTAGNSSTINDGAAALLIASGEAVKKYNLTPIVRITSYASSGVDPSIMGIAPVMASRIALKKAGWSVGDLDVIESNEAFAAQSEYVNQQMQWDVDKVNINGGSIALGHPIGASGARILTSLVHEMKRSRAKKGLATLCIGGGMGIAMCVETA